MKSCGDGVVDGDTSDADDAVDEADDTESTEGDGGAVTPPPGGRVIVTSVVGAVIGVGSKATGVFGFGEEVAVGSSTGIACVKVTMRAILAPSCRISMCSLLSLLCICGCECSHCTTLACRDANIVNMMLMDSAENDSVGELDKANMQTIHGGFQDMAD